MAAISPIWAEVETPGSLNGPALIHLLNPAGSGKTLHVRKLRVYATVVNLIVVRRTSSPITLAGAGSTLVNDTPVRMDERDVTAIVGELKGTNFAAPPTAFGITTANWWQVVENDTNGWIVLDGTDFSETIAEGSAIEACLGANGAGISLRMHAVWDEL